MAFRSLGGFRDMETEPDSPLLVATGAGQELVDVNLMNANAQKSKSGGSLLMGLALPAVGYAVGGKYGAIVGLGLGLLVSRR